MVKFVDVGVLYFFLVWPEQPPVAIRIFIFLFLAKFPEPGGGVAPRMARSPSPPSPFECPITMEIMSDPVVLTATGHTFERAAIESHLKQYSTCPMTNVEVTDCKLVPNYALKSVIDQEKKRKAGAAQHLSVGYAERVPSMPTPRMNRSPSPAASGKTAALSGVARQGSDVANGEKTAVQRGVWKGSGHTGGKPAAARSTANLCARVTARTAPQAGCGEAQDVRRAGAMAREADEFIRVSKQGGHAKCDDVGSIVAVMRTHAGNVDVQIAACNSLHRLACERAVGSKSNTKSNARAIVEQSGLQRIREAMEMHRNDRDVLDAAIDALHMLAASGNQAAIAEAGVVRHILRAMDEHPADWTLQNSACTALFFLLRLPADGDPADSRLRARLQAHQQILACVRGFSAAALPPPAPRSPADARPRAREPAGDHAVAPGAVCGGRWLVQRAVSSGNAMPSTRDLGRKILAVLDPPLRAALSARGRVRALHAHKSAGLGADADADAGGPRGLQALPVRKSDGLGADNAEGPEALPLPVKKKRRKGELGRLEACNTPGTDWPDPSAALSRRTATKVVTKKRGKGE